jgi:exoribonuclease-2
VLAAVARRALAERGFDFSRPPAPDARDVAAADVADLRHLPWSSVDNPESRDLDQVEAAEALPGGRTRLHVGVADVDAHAPAGSAVDAYAARNATSVYAAAEVFPMLPPALSEHATSLLDGAERLAVVVSFDVDAGGQVAGGRVARARVRNHARLAYGEVAAWLDGAAPAPALAAALARLPALAEQLRLQDAAAERLRAARQAAGALDLDTVEARAVVRDGRVVGVAAVPEDRARGLVASLMLAANGVVAAWLAERGRTGVARVMPAPARWDRLVALAAAHGGALPPAPSPPALAAFLERRRAADPAGYPDLSLAVVKLLGGGGYAAQPAHAFDPHAHGHFALGAVRYTHSTAPNRRYADLLTQRLVKAALAGAPAPYDDARLAELAALCAARESAARAVERVVGKSTAALVLRPRVGAHFDAVVTGVKAAGTYARLVDPPAEGRVVAGEAGLDVGDRVRVRLVAADPERGHLDFAALRAA